MPGMDFTELETFVLSRANITIAPVNGRTVIVIESRDRRKDGLYEAKAFEVTNDCNINGCRQDAVELGIDAIEACRLTHQPDVTT